MRRRRNTMKDDTVSRAAVMQSLTKEYNRRRTGDGLKLAWIEKAVNEVPAVTEARINLNESIKVKLTDLGKDIYYHRFDAVNKAAGKEICKPCYPKEDEDGYTKFQLWCFMALYGEHMSMTAPAVIKPLEIVYEEEQHGSD
jgi:hypothetical protein